MLDSKNKSEAYFYLGQIYFVEKKIDSAKVYFEKGISADANEPLNYAGLVKCNLYSNANSDAEKNVCIILHSIIERYESYKGAYS